MKTRVIFNTFLIGVLLFTIIPLSAMANGVQIWYVSPEGDDTSGTGTELNPWRTIGYAVGQAVSGDTIRLMDDDIETNYDYRENVTVDKSLTIERYDDIGANPQVKASSIFNHTFNITEDYVTIKGLDIYGATGAEKAAIHLDNVSGCTIEDNRCGWGASFINCYGIYMENSSGNAIANNTCMYNNHGIRTHGATCNVISGNTCSSNTAYGMRLRLSSNTNTVSDNTCNSNNTTGIRICSSSSYNTVTGNTCNSNSSYGIQLYSALNNTVYLNNLSGNLTNVSVTGGLGNVFNSPTELCYFHSPSHKSRMGNYYGDDSHNPSNDFDNDGICDDSYSSTGMTDSYPLMQTSDNYSIMAWWLDDPAMCKANVVQPPGSVTVSSSNSEVWVADEAAQIDVVFPEDAWTGQITFSSAVTGSSFTVSVGYADPDGTGFSAGGPQATLSGTKTTFTYTTSTQSFTVPAGKHLALRITNGGTVGRDVRVGGALSYLSAPDTSCPEYPVPELSTILLMSIGLMGLGGYIWLRKRKPAVTSAS